MRNSFENNKSTGNDFLTAEIYKAFNEILQIDVPKRIENFARTQFNYLNILILNILTR